MHRTRLRGFTLIELLVVVVILGILAIIAIPKFASTKGSANMGAMRADLRNLATAQESYFYSHDTYSSDLGALSYSPSSNVTVTVSEATAGGWSAVATHPQTPVTNCAVFFGSAAPVAPATVEGRIACQ